MPWTTEQARKWAPIAQAARLAAAKERSERVSMDLPPICTDSYSESRLKRVRKQLGLVDAMIEQLAIAADPGSAQALDRLASAQLRLSEQERVLAGRPLPGSRRPARERSVTPKSGVDPV